MSMNKENYKKLLVFLPVLFFSISSVCADSWTIFTGTVTNVNNDQPVAQYPVFITLNDSMVSHTVMTDINGVYSDSLLIDPVGFVRAEVTVYDCQQLAHTVQFTESDSSFQADFSICILSGSDCQAQYNSEPDSLDPYTIHFYNLSQGNFTTLFWEFGDGTGSADINPTHQFNASGQYQVCLTIQDSLGNCEDTYCSYITVGENSCNANFYWQMDGTNPLYLYFFDNSTGNITNWIWDFGDTNSSNEEFPEHQYSEAGQYLVKLVVSDSVGLCSDSISKWIYVGGDSVCIADFAYDLDTLNNTPDVYQFTDQSEGTPQYWMWNFGDGEVSFEQNPIHIYEQEGTYQVCLTISNNNPLGDCYDTICKSITTPEYFDFGGQVFIGDFPLNIEETDSSNRAVAYLYRKYMNKWELMDSREFWKYGYYWFTAKPAGEYIIRTDLLQGSIDYSSYSPTYFENSNFWTQAKIFSLNNNEQFAVNLSLKQIVDYPEGNGSITGILQPGVGCTGEIELQSELIYLMNMDYQVLSYTYTDENGLFGFSNLGYGTYLVKAETTGKLSQSIELVIDENESTFDNITLTADCNSFVSVEEFKQESDLLINKVYPQPATNFIYIELNSVKSDRLNIQFINVEGSIVLTDEVQTGKGKLVVEQDVNTLSRGLYLLKITTPENSDQAIKKILIY
jgi:PKD repeat protein